MGHLTKTERHRIEQLLRQQKKFQEIAISVSAGLFYDFLKTISGDEVEKLRIYAIVIHRSGLFC